MATRTGLFGLGGTVAALAACAGLSTAAAGQIVPPPEEKPAEEAPVYERPEAVPVAPDRGRIINNFDFSNVPFESLIVKDEFGRIEPLDKPIDWAAMDANTLLKENDVENYHVVLAKRVGRIEQRVLDHLDVLIEIDSNGFIDLIEGVGGGDEEAELRLQGVVEQIRPVMTQDSIQAELAEARMILERQRGFTDYIARQYKGAVLDQAREGFEPEPGQKVGPVDMMLRAAFYQQLDEPLYVYRQMLGDTTYVAVEQIGQMELSEETRSQLLRKAREMDAYDTVDGKAQVMRELILELGSGQRLELFQAALEARDAREAEAETASGGE